MVDTNYISISGGIYQDTEHGFEIVTISGGIMQEQEGDDASTLLPNNLNGTPTTNQITWTWQAGS